MKHKEVSEKYSKWIVKFYSKRFLKPVFFVWLTDTSDQEEEDQLLITKSRKIITAKSERKLIERILENKVKLPDSKRTKKWLKKSLNFRELSSTIFDLRKVEKKILSNKLTPKDIEGIINFINLYEDYKFQLGKKEGELKSRAKGLCKIWNYYYEEIFFPNFSGKNQKIHKPAKLKIDNKKLFNEFSKILKDFESKFEFIKKKKAKRK